MSDNKRKYFLVTTEQVVSANNKADALAKAQGRRGVDANVISTEMIAERISATEAKTFSA